MKHPFLLLVLSFLLPWNHLLAQTCTTLGQSPGTAFPVCGTTDFVQDKVPLCGGRAVPGPCNETILSDVNPFWYRFTCYEAGFLGFEITPNNLADDYDWQLFDITGKDVEDVYSDQNLFVACNWSAYGGVTGASDKGTSLISCSGANPIWSMMPELVVGHEYLLLVSHFTGTQSGYSLSFKGGTAGITDQLPAAIQSTNGYCSGNSMFVKLNKPIKCSSIATDGSDFSIAGGSAAVVGAGSPVCLTNFVTDSIIVNFDEVLPPGSYQVNLRRGNDGNTLLNICDVEVTAATSNFMIYESADASFTYQIKSGCEVDTINFSHPGANHVSKWNWNFGEITSANQHPEVHFNSSGEKSVQLIVFNDHCSDTAVENISLAQKVQAAFEGPSIICAKDPAVFTDRSLGGVSRFFWDFGNNITSRLANPDPFNFPFNNGEVRHRITLSVSDENGCTDTASADVVVVGNCNIVVPSAFSPNHDGRNDELYPTNAFNADDLVFRVFNRYGQIIFESHDWQRRWDGTMNGQPQPAGAYVWTLSYKLKTNGKPYYFKGTTMLVR